MKRVLFCVIFLIAAAFVGKLKAEFINSEYYLRFYNSYAFATFYNIYNEETLIAQNDIFQTAVKEAEDSLLFKKHNGSSIKYNTRHKFGFITGYGGQKELNVSYDYDIVFFQFQYYYSLLKKKHWGLEVLLQPQYNATKYINGLYAGEKIRGHEFGLNMGFLARQNIVKDIFSSYVFISAGPHYVSGTPERQADGFIFSDNFFAGVSVRVFKSLYLDMRGGFRHISNAGFKNPNKGINNLIFNEGFYLAL